MSLQDLIRSAHNKEEFSSTIDLFLQTRPDDEREPGWHPSAFAGMCMRQRILLELLGKIKEEDVKPRTKKIWDVGKVIHWLYQNEYLGKMGALWGKWKCLRCGVVVWGKSPSTDKECYPNYDEAIAPGVPGEHIWDYKEVPVKATVDDLSKPIVGHADGLLYLGGEWYVLELKSINQFGFQKLVEPKYEHWCQGQVYGELIRQRLVRNFKGKLPIPKKLLVGYVNKNLSEEKVFISPLDGKKGRELLYQPKAYEMSYVSKRLPEQRQEGCDSLLAPKVKKCPVGTYCYGTLSWDELVAKGLRNG